MLFCIPLCVSSRVDWELPTTAICSVLALIYQISTQMHSVWCRCGISETYITCSFDKRLCFHLCLSFEYEVRRRVQKAKKKCMNMNFICDKCSHNILHSLILKSHMVNLRARERARRKICDGMCLHCGRGIYVNSVFILNWWCWRCIHFYKKKKFLVFQQQNWILIDLVCFSSDICTF